MRFTITKSPAVSFLHSPGWEVRDTTIKPDAEDGVLRNVIARCDLESNAHVICDSLNDSQPKKKQTRAEWLEREIRDQERWIKEHGGDPLGYVERYGSKDDPEHYGDGGEAIYAADTGALVKLLVMRDGK